MATYYQKESGPSSPEAVSNRQAMAKIGELTANPQSRDFKGNPMAEFTSGTATLEDILSKYQTGGQSNPNFNPNIGPQIDYGQGKTPMTPGQLGALAQGKSVQDASQIGAPVNQEQQTYNQGVQQFNQSQYAKLAGQLKGAAPAGVNQGMGVVSAAMQDVNPPKNQNVQNFLQSNPTIQTANQEWMNFNNPMNLQSELMKQMQTIVGQQAQLGSLKAEYMNVQNIMGGTEDDIRSEVEKAGGFATDSQVQALTIARNKTLMKKAALLQNQMALQQDAIENSTSLLKFEQEMAKTQFEMTKFAYEIQKDAKTAALSSLESVVKVAGYSALLGSPEQNARVEQLYGLPKGGLQQLAAIDEKKRTQADLKTQLDLENQQLQNQKLVGDIKKQIADAKPVSAAQKQLESEYKIENINSLSADPALVNAVGPTSMNRLSFVSPGMANFIAGVDQLTSQLTLDKLIEAKKQGATFGSLTEGERIELQNAATKINSWRVTEDNKTVGYAAKETDFKKEFDVIKRMYAVDYVKNGGNPQMIGLQPLDGNQFAFRNFDGSYETVKIEK